MSTVGCTRWDSPGAGGTDSLGSPLTWDVPLVTRPFQPEVTASVPQAIKSIYMRDCMTAFQFQESAVSTKGFWWWLRKKREREVGCLLGYMSSLFDSCSIWISSSQNRVPPANSMRPPASEETNNLFKQGFQEILLLKFKNRCSWWFFQNIWGCPQIRKSWPVLEALASLSPSCWNLPSNL